MRLLLAVPTIALLGIAPAAAAAPLPRAPAQCAKTARVDAGGSRERLQPRKLDSLPDANAYKAVWRHVGGCEVPVVVRYRVSGGR